MSRSNSSSRLKTEVFPATGRIVVGPGNFLLLIQTPAAINVSFVRGGTQFGAEGVEAGYVKGLVEGWERCSLEGGTPGTTVRFFVGEEQIQEDFTDYRRTVGVFQQQLAASANDATDVDVGGVAGPVVVAAANPGRRRVTIKLRADADVAIRVGTGTVTATRGIQLNAGDSQTFECTGAISAIREAAGVAFTTMNEELY